MKLQKYLIIILLVVLMFACSEQTGPHPAGRILFAKTGLSFETPANWLRTKIPGNDYPVVYTDINYGIQPNIQLEKIYKSSSSEKIFTTYIDEKKSVYSDYTILNQSVYNTNSGISGKKIIAKRTNNKNIPIIHTSFIFSKNGDVYIITVTCAEPGLQSFETIFDNVMKSVEISD